MAWLEPLAVLIGEAAAYLVGLIVGRTFDLDAEKAQAIGEYVIVGIIAAAAVAVTFTYS